MTKISCTLVLSLIVLGISPGRLATGYLFAPDRCPEPAPISVDPGTYSAFSIKPESNFWRIYSDIRGDLKCGHNNVMYIYKDNGIRRRARELGYKNQLLGLDHGGEKGTNILLLGIDRRGKRGRGRSDTILLIRVVPQMGILTLSIPRDTKVPMRRYQDKIAHMYLYGGVERTRTAVENLLGVKIDHYLVVESLSHFKTLLSLIRGVDIDKHLEGRIGLKWIRNRTFARGDFERVMRTQIFIKATIAKAWSLTDGGDERLANVLARTGLLFVNTDLSVSEILELVEELRKGKFDPLTQVHTGHLGGRTTFSYSPIFGTGLSFIEPSRNELKHLSKLFTDTKRRGSDARSEQVCRNVYRL